MASTRTRSLCSPPTMAPRSIPGPTAAIRPLPAQNAWIPRGPSRAPAIIRWPGKVPAGKVSNGIMSGLDWFPTLVAAAGNATITDELLKGKQLGDKTYKVHLDGYDQTDLITVKRRSKRHEAWYFAHTPI